jgi:putative membrane protein
MSGRTMMRAVAGTAGVLLIAGAAAPGVAAMRSQDSGNVQATVRKTVLQTATAEGEVLTSRMYTQVSAAGSGTKTVVVPVGTDSNRNLNEFGPFPMEGQAIVFELDVDGTTEARTLTDADIQPMEVSVAVTLDGRSVSPEDLVGAEGVVDVQYTVRNTTARTEDITYTDVDGNQITESVEVADPYAGSLDIDLPQGFNEVTAPGATVAGDGTNQTSLGYSFVLFPPLGATEATVGYQARISNGEMPAAVFSFLPIIPLDNSTIASTAEAYQGGAAVGATIYDAGVEIGNNLVLLQEGAGQLVAGLGQLAAGAASLQDGLVNTAAPGAAELADGTGQVSDGLSELNGNVPALADGVEQLDDGANLLADGLDELEGNVPALADGVQQLDDGAQLLDSGAGDLAAGMASLNAGLALLAEGVQTLSENPAVKDGVEQLQSALAGVQAAIGTKPAGPVATPTTLNEAITNLEFGLDNAACDSDDPENAANPCGFKQVLEILDSQLDNESATEPGAKQALTKILGVLGETPPNASLPLGGFVTATESLFTSLGCAPSGGSPTGGFCAAIADPTNSATTYGTLGFYLQALGSTSTPGDTVLYGLNAILAKIGSPTTPGTALYAIGGLVEGIGAPTDFPTTPDTLYYGLEGIRAGLTNPRCDVTNPTDPANPCGIKEVQGLVSDGIDDLVQGISAALLTSIGTTPPAAGCDPTATLTCASAALTAGAQELALGAELLADGTTELNGQVPGLAAGVSQLAEGGEALADGTGELNDQVPALADGVQQLDEGAALVDDGANQLADGLGDAAEGSELLTDGLREAEPGGAQLEDGALQLKEEGADALAETGAEAQLGYARDVALIDAAQQLGVEGAGVPFGFAEGTDVTTTAVVQMQLAGISADNQDDALKIGLGVVLIAGAAGLAFAASRRLVV